MATTGGFQKNKPPTWNSRFDVLTCIEVSLKTSPSFCENRFRFKPDMELSNIFFRFKNVFIIVEHCGKSGTFLDADGKYSIESNRENDINTILSFSRSNSAITKRTNLTKYFIELSLVFSYDNKSKSYIIAFHGNKLITEIVYNDGSSTPSLVRITLL